MERDKVMPEALTTEECVRRGKAGNSVHEAQVQRFSVETRGRYGFLSSIQVSVRSV